MVAFGRNARRRGVLPTTQTCAAQQVCSYPVYSSRDANAFGKADRGPQRDATSEHD
jgi:hypothetical protein